MAVNKIPAGKFLEMARSKPVIDVRSPLEFEKGHIPGARNIPLFEDLERAEIGKLFHHAGKDEAVHKGLEIAGPKMKFYVDEAKKIAINKEVLIYCWRGGMRSESMAWLFSTSGLNTTVLENGYKGFRKYNRNKFEEQRHIVIISGKTGSGKTSLLNALSNSGQQVIDLEDLANHKGSVFGNLGLPGQPTNEHFENLLAQAWNDLDPNKPVFLEDESFNIGRDSIPYAVFQKMQKAPLFIINMPVDSRVKRLHREYAHFSKDILISMINKIGKRLGDANAKAAIKAIEEGRLEDAIRVSLRYYDKAYTFDLKKKSSDIALNFAVDDVNVDVLAEEIIHKATEIQHE